MKTVFVLACNRHDYFTWLRLNAEPHTQYQYLYRRNDVIGLPNDGTYYWTSTTTWNLITEPPFKEGVIEFLMRHKIKPLS